ncbi:MAG: thiamine-phosphate kinase [Gallionella sp.]|nr:thiamine-phosphate kinase [Gallionella sp.]MDD4959219.1 thiamine-phosphate kinase [Gallionella sp.]
MSEFDLIRRHFTRPTPSAVLGVGDDAALFQVSEGNVLAVSSDMLVSGTHFFPDADPYWLGHKTLAVNLSDMAAMGANPRWATLAIALPSVDEAWLSAFSAGFFALAKAHHVELIGGDTTRGALNLCVTILGEVPQHQALRRAGAQVGDEIWVSGCLGDAALALAHLQQRIELTEVKFAAVAPALHQPQPRVALGLALRGIANSALDISDGLLGDLAHILDASQVGATVELASIPVSETLRGLALIPCPSPAEEGSHAALLQQFVLSGGDDYELCFTAPVHHHADVVHRARKVGVPVTRIGHIVAGQGCVVRDAAGKIIKGASNGYDHFR